MDPCQIIVSQFRIEKVDSEPINDFYFSNPLVVEIIDTDKISYLMITELTTNGIETEEARISANYLPEIEKLISETSNINHYFKIYGLDENKNIQHFYIKLTTSFISKLKNELEYKKLLYTEIQKLATLAKKATDETSEEYKSTIEKNISIFKKLANK